MPLASRRNLGGGIDCARADSVGLAVIASFFRTRCSHDPRTRNGFAADRTATNDVDGDNRHT